MKILLFAKELTNEAGRQVTPSEVVRVLSKKRDGLTMASDIDEKLMNYAKMMITGEKAEAPAKKSEPKAAAAAPAKKPAKKAAPKTDASKEKAPSKSASKSAAKPAAKRVTPLKPRVSAEEKEAMKKGPAALAAYKRKVAAENAALEAAKKPAKAPEAVEPAKTEEVKVEEKIEEVKTTSETVETAPAAAEAPAKVEEKVETAPGTKTEEKAEVKPEVKPEAKAETKPEAKKDNSGNKSGDRGPRGDRSDRPAKSDKFDKKDKSDDKFDKKNRSNKPAKAEASEAPSDSKKSSGRKGDKSKDKEKEARRENRETRNSRREDKRSKKDFRNVDDMDTGERRKKPAKKQEKKEEEVIKTVTLPEVLTLGEFASKIKQPVNQLIKKLFLEGKMYTVNSDITYEEAELIALEYNIICEQEVKVDIVEEALRDIEDPEDSLVTRPPVVCVMGHVDHGKTSLLDAIRKTSVTTGEAGGITQHIGAYTVEINGRKITFLDTPGHEAFTAMRLRGAMATDIAILVVAADDGVMPQTVEAINHAKAAGIEIIVAVNKIDKPSANIERVKQELTEYGLIAEDWGGSTVFAPVSAHTHEGIDNLLEMILLTSDILELKANPKRKARGIVIEAKLDKGRGAVATLLVQKGTLKVGDFIAIGESHGRVRAMTDDKQKALKEATPSMPVEVIGLSTVPNTGEIFIATDTEKEARNISDAFITRGKENLIAETKAKMSLDDIFNQMQEGTLKELNIIIKADVQGSVEALKQSLLKLSNEEIVIKCIHSGVGAINESDVTLAGASGAIIIGFNVRPEPLAKQLADNEKVDIRLYKVIYNAIDDIESAMKGMLDPIFEEKVIGHGVIRQTFKASGIGTIAGTFVEDGAIERNASARISRGGDQIWEGKIASLKRFNDDAKEVKAGYECGIVFDSFNDVREDDTIEVYKMVEIPRT
ncbi:translation initiation factor IF-2 [Lachnospiraceae bacterium NE2001]|nr:translation initiation factor IF-2 [Lachnospiraceae bacterium NE2001]